MLSFFVVEGGEASSFDRSVLASFRYSGFPCESGGVGGQSRVGVWVGVWGEGVG